MREDLALWLDEAVVDDLRAQLQWAGDREVAGMLGGVGRRICRVYRVQAARARSFAIYPAELARMKARMRADGHVPLAVYHSHPRGDLTPSGEDELHIACCPYPWMIVTLDGAGRLRARAYAARSAAPIPVVLSPPTGAACVGAPDARR